MKTKLTLTVDDELIRRTKRFARKRNTSVSGLFQEWASASIREEEHLRLSESLTGRWSQVSDEDPRLAYLLDKHGG